MNLRLLPLVVLLSGIATQGWAQSQYQAESAQLSGGVNAGSSGGVSYAENITQRGASAVTFGSVTVAETKVYALDFRYSAALVGARSVSIYVNGVDVVQALFPSTNSWYTWAVQTTPVRLQAGVANSITVRYDSDDSGWINLDYLQVNSEPLSAGFHQGAASTADWFPSEISVDKFTGTAQLYLPLHTVEATGISLPVGLAYTATGVRVDERGEQVGVNWNLAGEVSISREVRGLPDDKAEFSASENRYGWLVYPAETPKDKIDRVPNAPTAFSTASCIGDEVTALQQLNQLGSLQPTVQGARNLFDTEPDIFTYTLPGHSGKFVFDAQGNARTIPYDHIIITHPAISPGVGISSFTIKTTDGTSYFFTVTETTARKVVKVAANPNYFLRDYWLYKLPDNTSRFSYVYSWQVSSIQTASNEIVSFGYNSVPAPFDRPARESRLLLHGGGSGLGTEEYRNEVEINKQYLASITAPATQVTFTWVPTDESSYYLKSVDVNSTVAATRIRQYIFEYSNPDPSTVAGLSWFDKKGNPISDGFSSRRFLSNIRLTNGCAIKPLYEFYYAGIEKTLLSGSNFKETVALPPPGANDRDYWGFYTVNGSQTLIPKLYVYPQLVGQPVTSAPYRLYEVVEPTAANGGFSLPGAERRPAACFNFENALAGTLTSMVLPSGGKAVFEYDAHRFYDAVAQQSYPAGGTRIRAIRVQDPITGIEARRDYGYLEDNGRASGALLRVPNFAFAVPATGSSPQQQWTEATVRCGDDLTEDPFEFRAIGYHQVSESINGKGQAVTVYNIPGTADEISAVDGVAAGITWSRPIIGLARQSYTSPTAGSSNCPSVTPLQAGAVLYPFVPAANYDFRRGLPQSIIYKATPVGTATAATIRQETFYYEYRNLAPSRPVIEGLSYEQLNNGTRNTYAYAKYPILTDFLFAIRHQTENTPNSNSATNVSETWYNYNAQGWLSAQGKRNSDGKGYRTRYKYLTDYPLTGSAGEPRFQAMQQRRIGNGELISADKVETITELVISPSDVRFVGATLNTFAVASQSGPTRPYQVLRWQPSAAILRADYDSTRVVTNTLTGNKELSVSGNFRLVSTVFETTSHLLPLSTRTEAGRQVSSVQLGYNGTLPVLHIANALSSEVLFSDFESVKDLAFSHSQGLNPVSSAARTGTAGAELANGTFLIGSLTTCANTNYRLSMWVRPNSTASITVSVIGGTTGTPPAAQTLSIGNMGGTWQYKELMVNLSGIPKSALSDYTLKVQTDALVRVDDVLFLPAIAAATSTTYDLTKGKTSETDERGRTTYYEYNVLGDLARIRDHNGSIVKQTEKVVAGKVPEVNPAFTVGGNQNDGESLPFTATTACASNLEYSWDFGDGTTIAFPASSSVTHPFSTSGQIQVFVVTLSARIQGQGKVYRSVQYIEVHPAPISVSGCIVGVASTDFCGIEPDVLVNTCDPNNIPVSSPANNVYTVTTTGAGLYYSWVSRSETGTNWADVSGQTTPSITVPVIERRVYQCIIKNSSNIVLGRSDVFGVVHYNSQGTALNPCPAP